MKKFFTATLVIFALVAPGCASAFQNRGRHSVFESRAVPERFWENAEATVTVKDNTGLGTGFVIRRDGYILTNWHVVAPSRIKTVAADGTERIVESSEKYEVCQVKDDVESCWPGILVKGDPARDLAVMKTEHRFPHAVTFVDDRSLVPFDFVYSWANVKDILPPSPIAGRYVNRVIPSRIGAKIAYLIMDLHANPGGSGSPLFDRTGRCVGVTMGITRPPGAPMEFVIPSHEIVVFLKEIGFKIVLSPSAHLRHRGNMEMKTARRLGSIFLSYAPWQDSRGRRRGLDMLYSRPGGA